MHTGHSPKFWVGMVNTVCAYILIDRNFYGPFPGTGPGYFILNKDDDDDDNNNLFNFFYAWFC